MTAFLKEVTLLNVSHACSLSAAIASTSENVQKPLILTIGKIDYSERL